MLPKPLERRICFHVTYDGTDFHGWQVQPGLVTIQGVLETIVSEIEGAPVAVHGSGRTDAGVHAESQTAAFTLTNPIPATNLQRAINRLLPPSVRIFGVRETFPDFHPRFDAVAKTYEYRIFRGELCPPRLWRYVHHYPYPLDITGFQDAALVFEGEHDFTNFAAADPHDAPGKSKVRRVFQSTAELRGDLLTYRVRGSGFLKHMVRRMAGALLETGKKNTTAGQIRELLSGSPGFAGRHSAPAKGLHLISVEYPDTNTASGQFVGPSDTLYP